MRHCGTGGRGKRRRGGRAPQGVSEFGLIGALIGRIGGRVVTGIAARQAAGFRGGFPARWAGLRDDGPLGLGKGARKAGFGLWAVGGGG
jgi:hypothetical protein